MSKPEQDWQDWAADWHADQRSQPPAPELLRQVRRQDRWMLLLTVGEVLLSMTMLVFSTWVWLRDPQVFWLVWLIAVWIFTATAQIFSLTNRAGIWRPAAQTTSSFLDLCHRRCLRKLRTVRFVGWLLAVELVFVAGFCVWLFGIRNDPGRGILNLMELIGWCSLLTLIFAGWTFWFRRNTLKELARLEELRGSLEDRMS